jgi:hypothetical protein
LEDAWLKPTSFVERFFPADRNRPCYGFYSPAIDRFIFVDSRDLFLSLRAATLFSSKVLLLVMAFDPPAQGIDNSNCYLWSPRTRIRQSDFHIPQLLQSMNNKRIIYRGPAPHLPEQDILGIQKYLGFVVRACYALYLTEALDNINAPEAYAQFFPEFRPYSTLDRRVFLEIEQAIYEFHSIDEAARKIDQILSQRLDLARRRNYYTRFNRLLYDQPEPPFAACDQPEPAEHVDVLPHHHS